MSSTSFSIILFDGVCNFCNRWVNFVIQRDKKRKFRFAALQSEKGQELLRQYHLSPTQLDTFILIENGKVYQRSAAGLKVLSQLDGAFLVYPLIVIPEFLRDIVYDFIAKNRYRWYGKRESCMVPTPEVRERFL